MKVLLSKLFLFQIEEGINMKKLLIFEDDYLSQELMRKVFNKDYVVDICESSEEYFSNYSDIYYCVILMDIALKGKKQGIELIKEIRNSPVHNNVPIICLTAHGHAATRKNALDAGADLFFTKPVHNTLLKEAIVSLIKEETHDN